MRYAILCYHSEAETGSWSKAKDDAVLAQRAVVKKKLAAQGKLGPVFRLMPTTAATTVRAGREPLVLDGPFAETKEQLGGVVVIMARDLSHAVELISKHPGVPLGVHLEIRPADEEINALIAARQAKSEPETKR